MQWTPGENGYLIPMAPSVGETRNMNTMKLNNSLISTFRKLSWLMGGVLAFSAIHASASEKNLLVDGSFEQGSGAELSGDWSVPGGRPATVTREKIPGASGDWVLKIHIPGGSQGFVADVNQNVDMSSLKAGDTVTISALAKVEGNDLPAGSEAFLSVGHQKTAKGLFLSFPRTPGDWKEIRNEYTLPESFDPNLPNGFSIHFYFGPQNPSEGDIDVFVDDIKIIVGASAR